MVGHKIKRIAIVIGSLLWGACCAQGRPESAESAAFETTRDLWSHGNLFAWCVVPFDARKRTPAQRAQMLASLGFKAFAYDWRENDIPSFDAEIDALETRGIRVLAWWFPFDADDPQAKATLEVFKRHHIHPQLWVPQSLAHLHRTPEQWAEILPTGFPVSKINADWQSLSDSEKTQVQQAMSQHDPNSVFPQAGAEYAGRVENEADRIRALVNLADPYGARIELYNHNGWFGMVENQLAIIGRLKQLGITNVGMVYNFSHARDELHDDSKDFPKLWAEMKSHVVAVNITGMQWEGKEVYPSQGDCELAMMDTIERSGWRGPIGVIAEKGGDAQITLAGYLRGLDWLAAELKKPGAGGARPFPPAQ